MATTKLPTNLILPTQLFNLIGRDSGGLTTEIPLYDVIKQTATNPWLSSNGGTTYTIDPGIKVNRARTVTATYATAMTKTLSAFAAGTGNGSLDTGVVANNTWYYAHAIVNGSSVDVLLSTSFTSPAVPLGWTLGGYIGSLKTNGSAQIHPFFQYDQNFQLKTLSFDFEFSAAAADDTQTWDIHCPPIGKIDAQVVVTLRTTAASGSVWSVLASDTTEQVGALLQPIRGPGDTGTFHSTYPVLFRTAINTIKVHYDANTAYTLAGYTIGWKDGNII